MPDRGLQDGQPLLEPLDFSQTAEVPGAGEDKKLMAQRCPRAEAILCCQLEADKIWSDVEEESRALSKCTRKEPMVSPCIETKH